MAPRARDTEQESKDNMISVLKPKNTKLHKATPTEIRRHRIDELLAFGIKPKDICARMGYSEKTVRLVSKLRREGKSFATKHIGGKRNIRTPVFMAKIERIFTERPDQSYRQTAKELGVHLRTVQRCAKELGFKSFQHRCRALLTTKVMAKRLERAEYMIDWLAEDRNKDIVVIWSDEKKWDLDAHKNRRNNRFIAKLKESVPPKWCSKNPDSCMMLGVITSRGDAMPPLWLDRNVDTEYYLEIMTQTVLPWIHSTYGPDVNWVWQQDGAPGKHSHMKSI